MNISPIYFKIFDFPGIFEIYLNNINRHWSMGDSTGLEVEWHNWDLNRPGRGDRGNLSENNRGWSNCQSKTVSQATGIGLLSNNRDRFDGEVCGRYAYSCQIPTLENNTNAKWTGIEGNTTSKMDLIMFWSGSDSVRPMLD